MRGLVASGLAGGKEGCVKAILPMLALGSLLLLSSCEDKVSKEEARIRREVDQRVQAARAEMRQSESRWHTARVVAFCLLAGGSLIWLMNRGGSPPSEADRPMLPGSRAQPPGHRRRVIDRSYEDDEPDEPPYRR